MKTLVLGCRPTLPNVEAEVNAVVAAAPGAELLLDPSAELAASRAPDYDKSADRSKLGAVRAP